MKSVISSLRRAQRAAGLNGDGRATVVNGAVAVDSRAWCVAVTEAVAWKPARRQGRGPGSLRSTDQ